MTLPDPFCEIVANLAPATIVHYWRDAMAIVPLDPVCDGHVIILPFEHADSAIASPRLAGLSIQYAAELAAHHDWPGRNRAEGFFLGHNVGGEEIGILHGQTIRHVHAHLIPRRPGDGLLLPWTVQQEGVEVRKERGVFMPKRGLVSVCPDDQCSHTESERERMQHRTVIALPWTAVETGSQQS